jgi:HK97 family phage prohead protease
MEFGTNALQAVLPGAVAFQRFSIWATEFKVLRDVKSRDGDGEFTVEGFATSPALDFCGDVLPPGALSQHLHEYQENPLYTYCHNAVFPIGTTYDTELTEQGLRYKARIISDPRHQLAQIASILIREGACRRSSIGYDALKFHYGTIGDGRRVRIHDEVRLHEIAAVPLAMNADTSVYFAKALGIDADRELECTNTVPYADLPLHPDPDAPWEWSGRTKSKILGETGDDWAQYLRAHLWYDPRNADSKEGYKLPIARMHDGELKAVWTACAAAMAVLLGARGGADISEHDRKSCYQHLRRYYAKFGKAVPEFKGRPLGTVIAEGTWPDFADIELKAGEKRIFEETEADTYLREAKGRLEGFRNIFLHWSKTSDGAQGEAGAPSGRADRRVQSERQRKLLEAARRSIDEVLTVQASQGTTGEDAEARVIALMREHGTTDLRGLTARLGGAIADVA